MISFKLAIAANAHERYYQPKLAAGSRVRREGGSICHNAQLIQAPQRARLSRWLINRLAFNSPGCPTCSGREVVAFEGLGWCLIFGSGSREYTEIYITSLEPARHKRES